VFDLAPTSPANAATLLASIAFLLGAAVNASGRADIQEDFVRYGFPSWWCWVTALAELATAILLLFPRSFLIGAALGACIMLAAILAVIRSGHVRHSLPPALFLVLLVAAVFIRSLS
jgi:uncharacterized membrane protein YphA (DoxX/SURF4 family)